VPEAVRRWEAPILKWSTDQGLDPNLVAALMMTESEGDPNAVSPQGAVGLMQVMGGPVDPDENIRLGTAELARYLARYGRIDVALAAYNAGPGAVDRYGGIPPYQETRDHVFRVQLRYRMYAGS
jgi:soluble lytic murein transglycosylase-like protein